MQTKRKEYWLDKPEEFYLWFPTGFERVDGKPVAIPEYPELDAFLYEHIYGWGVFLGVLGMLVSEPTSLNNGRYNGLALAHHSEYSQTPEQAIERASRGLQIVIGRNLEKLRETIDSLIERGGLSPRYRWQEYDD